MERKTVDKFEAHWQVDESDQTAVAFIKERSQLSVGQIKKAMKSGAVWITVDQSTQRLRRAKRKLKSGQEIHLYYDEKVLNSAIEEPVLVKDNKHYSVWYKPYGVWSQGSKWGDHCTLARYAEQNLRPERPAFIVHRLDRATRGLMLLAHSKEYAANLSQSFANRNIKKTYQAIIHGRLSFDKKSISEALDGKEAISHIDNRAYCSKTDRSLVFVGIDTGRKHQIRRHLSGLGYPIVGDRLYGSALDTEENLMLLAYQLVFKLAENVDEETYVVDQNLQLVL